MTARTVPPIPSFAYQEAPTSGKINEFGTYLSYWSNGPMFRMFQSAAQSIPTSTNTQITMDSATGTAGWDTDSGRASTSPWSYVVPVGLAGRWELKALVVYVGNATGGRQTIIYQNGVATQGFGSGGNAGGTVTCGFLAEVTVLCSVGDTLSVYGWQNSGAALNTNASGNQVSYFEGRLVSFANP